MFDDTWKEIFAVEKTIGISSSKRVITHSLHNMPVEWRADVLRHAIHNVRRDLELCDSTSTYVPKSIQASLHASRSAVEEDTFTHKLEAYDRIVTILETVFHYFVKTSRRTARAPISPRVERVITSTQAVCTRLGIEWEELIDESEFFDIE